MFSNQFFVNGDGDAMLGDGQHEDVAVDGQIGIMEGLPRASRENREGFNIVIEKVVAKRSLRTGVGRDLIRR